MYQVRVSPELEPAPQAASSPWPTASEPPTISAAEAIAAYAADVRDRRFPGPEHVFADEVR